MRQKQERPEIHLSNKTHDFSNWFAEKTCSGLKHLSQAADYMKDDGGMHHLRAAIAYQIALLAMVNGFEDRLDMQADTERIVNEGYLGYQKFLKQYGVTEGSGEDA